MMGRARAEPSIILFLSSRVPRAELGWDLMSHTESKDTGSIIDSLEDDFSELKKFFAYRQKELITSFSSKTNKYTS